MTTKPTIPAAAPTRTAVIPASHPSMSPNPGPRDAPAKNPCFVVTANPSLAKRIATAYGNSPPVHVFLLPSGAADTAALKEIDQLVAAGRRFHIVYEGEPGPARSLVERYAASASPARLPALDASTIKQAIGAIVDRASDQKTPMTPSVARLFAAPSRTEIAAAYAERLTKLIAGRRPAGIPEAHALLRQSLPRNLAIAIVCEHRAAIEDASTASQAQFRCETDIGIDLTSNIIIPNGSKTRDPEAIAPRLTGYTIKLDYESSANPMEAPPPFRHATLAAAAVSHGIPLGTIDAHLDGLYRTHAAITYPWTDLDSFPAEHEPKHLEERKHLFESWPELHEATPSPPAIPIGRFRRDPQSNHLANAISITERGCKLLRIGPTSLPAAEWTLLTLVARRIAAAFAPQARARKITAKGVAHIFARRAAPLRLSAQLEVIEASGWLQFEPHGNAHRQPSPVPAQYPPLATIGKVTPIFGAVGPDTLNIDTLLIKIGDLACIHPQQRLRALTDLLADGLIAIDPDHGLIPSDGLYAAWKAFTASAPSLYDGRDLMRVDALLAGSAGNPDLSLSAVDAFIREIEEHLKGREEIIPRRLFRGAEETTMALPAGSIRLRVGTRDQSAIQRLGARYHAPSNIWYIPAALDTGLFDAWIPGKTAMNQGRSEKRSSKT